jgi:Type III restriction enzyme, res subunit
MIEIRPSSIVIHDYEQGECTKLERSLSLWNPNFFRVDWSAMLEEDDKLIIPGGYNLDSLKAMFPNRKVVDVRKRVAFPARPCKFKVNGQPRDIRQQNALSFLEASTPYFSYAAGRTQKLLCLETGGGKTFVAILYASKFNKVPIVIVDQETLITQWKNEFLKLTNLEEEDIGIVLGIDSIRKLTKNKATHKVYIASHRTLASYGKDNPWLIQRLFNKLGIGLKIFDEAHIEWKNIFTIDSVTDTEMTLYLTATPGRSNQLEDIIYQNMFEGIAQYGIEHKYKEEKNYHKVVYVNYNTHPTTTQEINMSNRYGFNVNGWCDYILEEKYDQFVIMIQSLIDMVYNGKKDAKVAVVVHTLPMVTQVIESLQAIYPDKRIGDFSTNVKNKTARMEELNADIIVTTDKSFDKAVNVMDLVGLINTVPMSSGIKIEQMIGRLRYVKGKPCLFFDTTDVGFKACKRQKKSRKEVLDLKAKSTFEMEL